MINVVQIAGSATSGTSHPKQSSRKHNISLHVRPRTRHKKQSSVGLMSTNVSSSDSDSFAMSHPKCASYGNVTRRLDSVLSRNNTWDKYPIGLHSGNKRHKAYTKTTYLSRTVPKNKTYVSDADNSSDSGEYYHIPIKSQLKRNHQNSCGVSQRKKHKDYPILRHKREYAKDVNCDNFCDSKSKMSASQFYRDSSQRSKHDCNVESKHSWSKTRSHKQESGKSHNRMKAHQTAAVYDMNDMDESIINAIISVNTGKQLSSVKPSGRKNGQLGYHHMTITSNSEPSGSERNHSHFERSSSISQNTQIASIESDNASDDEQASELKKLQQQMADLQKKLLLEENRILLKGHRRGSLSSTSTTHSKKQKRFVLRLSYFSSETIFW